MFTTFDKAWIPALLAFASAVVMQMTGMGDGPTPDQIGALGDLAKDAFVAVIYGALVYIIPNKAA